MAYNLYIIYSPKTDRYYIGVSGELENRLARHNKGTSRSTKNGSPEWRLVYKSVALFTFLSIVFHTLKKTNK